MDATIDGMLDCRKRGQRPIVPCASGQRSPGLNTRVERALGARAAGPRPRGAAPDGAACGPAARAPGEDQRRALFPHVRGPARAGLPLLRRQPHAGRAAGICRGCIRRALVLRGVRAHSSAIALHDVVLPGVVGRPPIVEVQHGARLMRIAQQIERAPNDVALHGSIERSASRAAQREVQEDRPRCADRAGDRQRARQAHRRDAARLDFPRDQSHGLVANRSDRHHQRHVHGIGLEPIGERRGERVADSAG